MKLTDRTIRYRYLKERIAHSYHIEAIIGSHTQRWTAYIVDGVEIWMLRNKYQDHVCTSRQMLQKLFRLGDYQITFIDTIPLSITIMEGKPLSIKQPLKRLHRSKSSLEIE